MGVAHSVLGKAWRDRNKLLSLSTGKAGGGQIACLGFYICKGSESQLKGNISKEQGSYCLAAQEAASCV